MLMPLLLLGFPALGSAQQGCRVFPSWVLALPVSEMCLGHNIYLNRDSAEVRSGQDETRAQKVLVGNH